MNCGVSLRRGSDTMLLWLWHRPAASALIQPLAWELPYAMGAAIKRKKIHNSMTFANSTLLQFRCQIQLRFSVAVVMA